MARTLLMLLACLIGPTAAPQQEPPDVVDVAESRLRGADVPDGIAFRMILSTMKWHYERNASDEMIYDIQRAFDADVQTSTLLFNQLIQLRYEMEYEAQLASSAHACTEGDPYEISSQLYDISEEIADRYYQLFKNSIDVSMVHLLDDWVQARKKGMAYTRIDAKKAEVRTGKPASERLAHICASAYQ